MELQEFPSRKFRDLPAESSGAQCAIKDEEHLPENSTPTNNPPNRYLEGIGPAEPTLSAAPSLIPKSHGLGFLVPIATRKWWIRHISLELTLTSDPSTGHDPRDHLALERTFLAYVRTAGAILFFGVVFTQLFRLHRTDALKCSILAAATAGGAIAVVLIGCVRFFKQQKSLMHGKTLSAGWDLVAILAVLLAIIIAVFVVLLAQD